MLESWPYREDLRAFARLFAAREKRQLWRDDSLAKAEKTLFVGFLFVRKLIECRKVTVRCAKTSVAVSRAAIRRDREVSHFSPMEQIDDINRANWSNAKIDVHQLADKIIHAWFIFPFRNEERGLGGFIFTTDKSKDSELFELPTSSIVTVFERFAAGQIRRSQAARDDNGRLIYWRAE